MPGYLHHLQWSVADVAATVSRLQHQYNFQPVAQRPGEVVLEQGRIRLLVSARGGGGQGGQGEGDYPRLASMCTVPVDSVFNVCLEVSA